MERCNSNPICNQARFFAWAVKHVMLPCLHLLLQNVLASYLWQSGSSNGPCSPHHLSLLSPKEALLTRVPSPGPEAASATLEAEIVAFFRAAHNLYSASHVTARLKSHIIHQTRGNVQTWSLRVFGLNDCWEGKINLLLVICADEVLAPGTRSPTSHKPSQLWDLRSC